MGSHLFCVLYLRMIIFAPFSRAAETLVRFVFPSCDMLQFVGTRVPSCTSLCFLCCMCWPISDFPETVFVRLCFAHLTCCPRFGSNQICRSCASPSPSRYPQAGRGDRFRYPATVCIPPSPARYYVRRPGRCLLFVSFEAKGAQC